MTHRPASSHTTVRRALATVAAAASLALLGALGTACLGELDESEDSLAALPEVDCTGLKEWAQKTVYPAGIKVTDTGDAFAARSSHTAFGVDWNPKSAGSLWVAVGHCKGAAGGGGGGGGGGQQQPPPPPPPPPGGGGQQQPPPPPPPPAGKCNATGQPGPKFDIAGARNVGNRSKQQFIGGQCLSAADCASGCCALPCGICSGPGAQFQAGKQGCGFGN